MNLKSSVWTNSPGGSVNSMQATSPTKLALTAQDFLAGFGLGAHDKHIAIVGVNGVALAAIQGLNQKLEDARQENAALQHRVERLEQLLEQLVNR